MEALTIIVGLVGLVLLMTGVATVAGTNFSDPINGLKQWIQGIMEVGVGSALILAAIGAAGVIAAVLSFLLSLAGRRDDGF